MLTTTNLQYFPASLQVGSGFDIYGEFSTKSVIARVFDPHRAGSQEIEIHGRRYAVPDYVHWRPHTQASFVEDVCETRDTFQNRFATEAGIKAEIGAFSGQMALAFNKEVETSAEHYFCCKNYYQTIGTFELRLGADLPKVLDPAFLNALQKLPGEWTPASQHLFDDFFDDYGTHLTSSIQIGGHLDYYCSVSKTVTSDKEAVRASMNAEYSAAMWTGSLDAKFESSSEHRSFANRRQINIRGAGGDPSLIGRVVGASPENPDLTVVAALSEWMQSIARYPTESKCTLKLISEICTDKEDAVAQAFEVYKARKRIEIFVEQLGPETQLPTILVGSKPIKPNRLIGSDEMGFQVVVLDRQQSAEPVVLRNEVVAEKSGMANVDKLYEQLRRKLESAAHQREKHLLLLTGAGLRTPYAPDSETYMMLLAAGGTDALSRWVEIARSQRYNPFPERISFCHIGIFGTGRGAGLSDLMVHTQKTWKFRSTAFLYGSRGDSGLYQLGAGSR